MDDVARAFSGRHVLAELAGIDAALLDDDRALRACLAESLTDAGATVLHVVTHRFEPRGVTVLAMLAESHASIHTWPERGCAFVDVFTCGDAADPERAVALLTERLGAQRLDIDTVHRGSTPGQVVEPMADGLRRVWDVADVLWSGRTAYQDVLIARTAHGITLFCDDERQSSEASQLVYHEALLVPALLLAERRDRVLVIGSSEGVVSELAVAAGASTVDHVDIDADCVRACARWLPYGYTPGSLADAERGDGPVRMHYEDGWRYLTGTDHRYDVVVVDLPDERPEDPSAQHNRLYGEEFLRLAASVLRPGGVVVGQAGCATLWRNETLLRSVRRFGEVFPTVLHYGSDEHEWSFLTGSPHAVPDPVDRVLRELPTLPYRPSSLDADSVRRGAVLPHAARHP
ncbi:adenosylmethionine decarboxylase [Pseudonocardia spinosispora]|uniref:adenosylmethionine decarboxylase n=1 Tax=Pseudonocardia spinosispora TaxID=103441 RepID=UPI00048E5B64